MRDLDPATAAAIQAPQVCLAFLAQLTFQTGPVYAWTGVGPLIYSGNTYQGVGQLAQIGTITEGTDVQAYGTTLTLNGINPTLYGDCMADLATGLPATVYLALLDATGAIIGTPDVLFSGFMDQASIVESGSSISITLHLENKLANLQRANRRLYASDDQRIDYPTDSGFDFASSNAVVANVWG